MKRIIFFIFLITQTISSFCQTPDFNLKKYWYLRWRLKNYFMVIGEGPGKSVPVGIRNFFPSAPINGVTYYSQEFHWGDNPNYLAHYIGVLATEYELLSKNGLNTSETLMELYYALKAINRLDECEAQYPWNQAANNLDGCMSRGDAPVNFVQMHYEELNRNLNQFNPTTNPGDPIEVLIGGDYEYDFPQTDDDKDGGLLSQDHISTLFVGLALVKKFIPDGLQINGVNLHDEAQNITERIIDYMQRCNWYLEQPDGVKISNGWGSQTWPYAYGFAKAATFIYPGHVADFMGVIPMASKPVWDAIASAYLGFTNAIQASDLLCDITNSLAQTVSNQPFTCDNSKNAWIILNLAAVGNSWETVLVETGPTPLTAACLLPGLDCTQGLIWAHSKIHGWEAFYPLLHVVLNNTGCLTDEATIEHDLNQMPCSGNWGSSNPSIGYPSGWATSHKYHNNPLENDIGDYGFDGIYNGLEYMLLFNLYNIHEGNDYINNYSLQYRSFAGGETHASYPATESTYLTNTTMHYVVGAVPVTGTNAIILPANVSALKELESSSVISNGPYVIWENNETSFFQNIWDFFVDLISHPNNHQTPIVENLTANVSYRAGETIILKPGFLASNGVEFKATIDPYTCNSTGTNYQRLAASDSTINDNESDVTILTKTNSVYAESENIDSGLNFVCKPNPFSENSNVSFYLSEQQIVKLILKSAYGQTIRILVNEELASGEHTFIISANELAAGVYLVVLETSKGTFTQRIACVK